MTMMWNHFFNNSLLSDFSLSEKVLKMVVKLLLNKDFIMEDQLF